MVNSVEIELKAKKWGDSIGFVIPKFIAKQENIRPESKIKVIIKRSDDISDIFGSLPRKMSGQEFKDKAREGWSD